MNAVLVVSRQFLRGTLPYPDLLRRWRIRRAALKLVTCSEWPGELATGMDAAQLALLRLAWLQRLSHNAVSERRSEDAALLARAALETCIVGLYCVHSGDPIARLSAPSNRGPGRPVTYLSDAALGSWSAIDSAVGALAEQGPELNIRDLALWLEREQRLVVATRLYDGYYVPLSHLFANGYAFALMRHVRPDGSIHRRPSFPWATRSAARMADGCLGLLAADIAEKSGASPEPFLRYAAAHLDRLLTPALVFTVKGSLRSGPLREFPGTLRAMTRQRAPAGRGQASQPAGRGQASQPAGRGQASQPASARPAEAGWADVPDPAWANPREAQGQAPDPGWSGPGDPGWSGPGDPGWHQPDDGARPEQADPGWYQAADPSWPDSGAPDWGGADPAWPTPGDRPWPDGDSPAWRPDGPDGMLAEPGNGSIWMPPAPDYPAELEYQAEAEQQSRHRRPGGS
jgi:hypothetical protein